METPRILIVDDNTMNVTLTKTVLAAARFVVETASSAAQALTRIAAFQPDLILLDIQMPGMNGLELTHLLKSDPVTRPICVVAFTAFAMRGDEAKMRAAGCDGYLSKPIDVNTFPAQVRACLAAWASTQTDHAGPAARPAANHSG